MHDSTSTTGLQRPRVRRGLGVLVGMTLMAAPLALAPAASAQTSSGNALGGLDTLVQGIVEGLTSGNTLAHPLGDGSTPGSACPTPDGLGSTLSCVVTAVTGGGKTTKAKVSRKVRRIKR